MFTRPDQMSLMRAMSMLAGMFHSPIPSTRTSFRKRKPYKGRRSNPEQSHRAIRSKKVHWLSGLRP